MTHILMLLENNPYPQDGRVRREATALVEAGYRVSVIAPSKPGQARRETVSGVNVLRYGAPPDGDGVLGYLREYGVALFWAFWLAMRLWRRDRFDVIHAHNPPDLYVLVGLLFRLFGVRFVFDHHDLSPEMYVAHGGGGLLLWLLRWFERLTLRTADHVISTNESYKQVAIERGARAAESVTVVRNGPDLARVRRVAPDPALRDKGHLIGYVGEMGAHDGVNYLLRALHHLRYEMGRTDFQAVLIGTGPSWEALRDLSAELKLDDHVNLTGFVSDEDLIRYLNSAEICVDPDPANPFNDRSTMIKMTEYMALGKPVVCFDLTEHRRTAGEAAIYVADNSIEQFATALVELMDDPERREQMGKLARRRAETRLAWHLQAPHLVEVYERLGRQGKLRVANV